MIQIIGKEQRYAMWFSRYYSPEIHIMDSLEECFDLDLMLEDADTETLDSYGVLCGVEILGTGSLIPADEYEAKFDEYKAQKMSETLKRRTPGPLYAVIGIETPNQLYPANGFVKIQEIRKTPGLDHQFEALKAFNHWLTQFGTERTMIYYYKGNESG